MNITGDDYDFCRNYQENLPEYYARKIKNKNMEV
jgi:hypothetical protein